MRWFAPVVIVALVAAGASRPADAARARCVSISTSTSTARSTATAREATGSVKLTPRRGVVGRGAVSDRRTDGDEVFVVPRVVALVAIPTLSLLVPSAIVVPRTASPRIDEVARGPPSLVVLSTSPI